MSSQDFSPPVADASRTSLGFPLGTGLLLIVIFSLSGIFSCCYHWEKLRSLRRSYSHSNDLEGGPSRSKLLYSNMTPKQQSLPVLMPGDNIPKFIALPCPCEPLRQEKTAAAEVNTPPKSPLQTATLC